jgi:hypothetical protein
MRAVAERSCSAELPEDFRDCRSDRMVTREISSGYTGDVLARNVLARAFLFRNSLRFSRTSPQLLPTKQSTTPGQPAAPDELTSGNTITVSASDERTATSQCFPRPPRPYAALSSDLPLSPGQR